MCEREREREREIERETESTQWSSLAEGVRKARLRLIEPPLLPLAVVTPHCFISSFKKANTKKSKAIHCRYL